MEKIASKDHLFAKHPAGALFVAQNSLGIAWGGVNDGNFWQVREQCRINDGTYTPIRVEGDDKMRFLHVSIDDPSKVSYTKDADKGKQDIQTRTTLAAYCEKFGLEMPEAVPVRGDIAAEIDKAAFEGRIVMPKTTIREKLGMIQDMIDEVLADIG